MKSLFSLRVIAVVSLFGLVSFTNARASSQEIWISAQPSITGGSGTQLDPYDGSTQGKFDALLKSLQNTPNLTIHLGPGTFRSDVTADDHWLVQSGWVIEGAGMYATTCQMMGNLTGKHWDIEFFKSAYNASTDHVVIRDLTVDCNWSELSSTADIGAKGEKYGAIFAIGLAGNDILIERVRHINSYGSAANGNEPFGIAIGAPTNGDATGNTIRDCRGELPQGNYGAPFALLGSPGSDGSLRLVTNSHVDGNFAAGRNNGLNSGFTTGGVNGAYLKDCTVTNNTFVDCESVYYQDTGSVQGLQVTNNSLTRGWIGVGLVASADSSWTKQDVRIAGNSLNLQNRVPDYGSASYAIEIYGAPSSGITISGNKISFSPNGKGFPQFLTICTDAPETATIANNVADETSAGPNAAAPVRAQVRAYDTEISANQKTNGTAMTGLANGYLQPLAKALNFSTRATVGTGQDVLIDGFIVTGSVSKKVLVRAIGPSLTTGGVVNALPDPTVALYDGDGKLVASNDNWKSTQPAAIQATGIPPKNDAESAIVTTLAPGNYTAVMSGKGAGVGVGLIEVYDLSPSAKSSLQNVSTRGFVGTSENVIIGGFIVGPGQDPTIVARGIGPSLAKAGIQNPLRDPILELHDGNGSLLASNNNWKTSQAAAIEASGLAPTDDRESAILMQLPSGNYTTILRGSGNSTGVALVEVYRTQ